MYAIAFDLKIDDLKKHYGDPYNGAYAEVSRELEALGFEWQQGSLYVTKDTANTLTHVYDAIQRLADIDWFKVEDWSDFTEVVKRSKADK